MAQARWALRRARPPVLILLLLALLLFACGGEDIAVPEAEVVTRLVTVPAAAGTTSGRAPGLVVVTATPDLQREISGAPGLTSDDTTHYRALVAAGPRTLDPALAADAHSRHLIQNVVEPLLRPDPLQPGALLPLLALDWIVGEDGLTYTFIIRRGVSFSNGNTLTADDVAYTLQRGLLQATRDNPFSLLLDPILGYSSGDVTEEIENGIYAGDGEALLADAPAQELLAVCGKVKAAVVADEAAGTVTITLARPWSPLPAALSQPWTGIIDREWAGAQGAWDGSCGTWGAWYAPADGDSLLATRILGTGPYILDHWTPGAEYVLVQNEEYWRQPSAPAGAAAIRTVSVRQEPAADLRWEALRSGTVDTADLPPLMQLRADPYVGEICTWPTGECRPGENADAPLRKFTDLTLPERHALFFNFNISSDENPYIGSGQLDGAGIPPTFFGDEHVRRAFAHCFDREAFIQTALDGHGRRQDSLLSDYYRVEGGLPAVPAYDLDACAAELAAAWDGLLPETGFWLQIPYDAVDRLQQQAALILQQSLHAAGDNYQVEIVGLAPEGFRQRLLEGSLPLALLGWTASLPDPHSWIAPAFGDDTLEFQRLPSALEERLTTLLDQSVSTPDTAERLVAYRALETQSREILPHIVLPQVTGNQYQQRWVKGWFYHPSYTGPYYYAYSLEGG